MSALHVFDMDGTLLQGTSAAIEISRRIGRLEPLAELERAFAAEQISAAEFAGAAHALWAELTAELVAEVVADAPSIRPAFSALQTRSASLRRNGRHSAWSAARASRTATRCRTSRYLPCSRTRSRSTPTPRSSRRLRWPSAAGKTWAFPGGKVDPGEAPADTVRRELLEETGLSAGAIEPVQWTSDVFGEDGLHYVTLHHLVAAEGDPAVLEPNKVREWRWCVWDDLPSPLFAPAVSLIAGGWRPGNTSAPSPGRALSQRPRT